MGGTKCASLVHQCDRITHTHREMNNRDCASKQPNDMQEDCNNQTMENALQFGLHTSAMHSILRDAHFYSCVV